MTDTLKPGRHERRGRHEDTRESWAVVLADVMRGPSLAAEWEVRSGFVDWRLARRPRGRRGGISYPGPRVG